MKKIELELELLHGGRVERNDGVVIVDCFIDKKTEKTRLNEKTRPRREKRKKERKEKKKYNRCFADTCFQNPL